MKTKLLFIFLLAFSGVKAQYASIAGLKAYNIQMNSASITATVTTNVIANVVVEYGTSENLSGSSFTAPQTANQSTTTSFIFNLSALSTATTYYWRIRVSNSLSQHIYSNIKSISTPAVAATGTFPQEFDFNGSVKNKENSISFDVRDALTYVVDRNGNPNSAVSTGGGIKATIPNLPLSGNARSVSIWIRPSFISNDNVVFVYGLNAGEWAYGVSFNNNTLYNFAWSTNASTTINGANFLNQWHHIVTTYDTSGNARIYIDGVLASTTNRPNWETAGNSYSFYLADSFGNGTSNFIGWIDDLKIYDTVLTDTQVNLLFLNNSLATTDFGLENSELKLYPNPVQDVLNIKMDTGIESIEIYNVQGQRVLHSVQNEINVSQLSNGIYVVRMKDKNNTITTKKIVKN